MCGGGMCALGCCCCGGGGGGGGGGGALERLGGGPACPARVERHARVSSDLGGLGAAQRTGQPSLHTLAQRCLFRAKESDVPLDGRLVVLVAPLLAANPDAIWAIAVAALLADGTMARVRAKHRTLHSR